MYDWVHELQIWIIAQKIVGNSVDRVIIIQTNSVVMMIDGLGVPKKIFELWHHVWIVPIYISSHSNADSKIFPICSKLIKFTHCEICLFTIFRAVSKQVSTDTKSN